MDIKTLKTFQCIVKSGSFIRAAEEMNYAQSTITMQIQKLEKEIGAQLFDRGKAIHLTEAGRLFYEQSLEIVHRMEQLQSNIADMSNGEAGSVRIGVTEPTASSRLPHRLAEFMGDHPQMRIAVEIASTPALVEQLLHSDLDFAICSSPEVGTDLHFEPLFLETFAMLLPEHHPLASHDIIQPADLEGNRLLITAAACPYRKKLDFILQDMGQIAIDTMEIGSMGALKHYVQSGLGIAFVPEIMVDSAPLGTVVRTMEGASVDMLTGMLCRVQPHRMSLAAAKLYHFLKRSLHLNGH
ncbi:LysR family transcriptional regulator [Paenibacillus alvei]|uniref:LysR family transcriptional regulator n=1 Tax=Paenibacillus alvei TaxID=44250 RepID=UPI0018CF8BDE|nr:LysR family transcriptional regulator [Paenibacillus alvei]MBG9734477.1 transcriptional regulator [Paenibacillus alvei]MBG9744219.1 transcriptional regulator [Paenibacillus alvei]MCY9578107.1 LysR family transcriptional regulator [Paenibacillus alvei]MCY9585401.1 LysR family transcriptional regulator [Paenibacillus alvei]